MPSSALTAWTKARLDRIRKIPIEQVLHRTGFDVRPDLTNTHQVFSCILHGTDSRPSGRTYPGSDSWYCWGCSANRDAVATVRERMGLKFGEALRWLEASFGLPPLPRPAGDAAVEPEDDDRPEEESSFDALERVVDLAARDRRISLDQALACWEIVDRAAVDPVFRSTASSVIPMLVDRVRGVG